MHAHAIQLDVTKSISITEAAEHIHKEYGRLDVLIQNAGIAGTKVLKEQPLSNYANTNQASEISIDEMRAIWETNVFGVLAVYQAMLPLLRQSKQARIVNISSSVGSLTLNTDPSFPQRIFFGPGYPASKTALNALTLAMAIELESEGIKVNAVTPGFTKTNLNGFTGTISVEEGASEAVRVAMLGADSPTGTFTHAKLGVIPW